LLKEGKVSTIELSYFCKM